MRRRLDALTDDPFDLLVLGGGITGAGVALDAVLRGLRVALLDKGDFASGTSSASSKLVHGGLRYLEHGDFPLVYEALHERALLLRNAPHLVRPLREAVLPRGRGGKRKNPWALTVLPLHLRETGRYGTRDTFLPRRETQREARHAPSPHL